MIISERNLMLFDHLIPTENDLDDDFDLSEIAIPFSDIFQKNKPSDIYDGEESIPFDERDPEFKEILKKEFLSEITA